MKAEPELIHRSDEVTDHLFKWYGWASPWGIGGLLVALGITALLVRVAIFGIK
jgi:hypothetical protein